ncbi:A-agglutinin anchorage subunit-like isoform X1 [Camellia sinensis]|uniref:A-agglutinin anchorage subunit-like isoform X1 n=1 Tax=Camellia sinensis TaxID=4442 RepID=UPI001035658F|nr:A-agglutinin anchorage subunit-like isoform X1 [Camellia sinensis]
MSSSSSSSSSESEQSSSSSSSSDEAQATLKMRVIPDPSASWHPPGSLPTTSHSSSTSHGSVSAGPSSSQATQKKTRGPTYVHGPWGTSENGVLNVASNELNQVVKGYTSLASHLGVLARDGSLAPLTFTTWHYVPQQNKDNIWREIKAHTNVDESMKRTIMASFGKKLRDWKSRVKKVGYKPFKNDAERLVH